MSAAVDPTRLSAEALTGRSREHVVQREGPRFAATPETADAFLAMRAAAARDGFDLRPFSSFRDLKTQTRIWNRKWRLEKPIYDRDGVIIDTSRLTDEAKIWAILGWSAAPGASRHHWGSEIDFVDGRAVDAGHVVDLLPYETAPGGPFHALHQWLDAHIAAFGFHRPYDRDRGGMFPEPWHLSHTETARAALSRYSVDVFREALSSVDIEGQAALLRCVDAIFERHVLATAAPPA